MRKPLCSTEIQFQNLEGMKEIICSQNKNNIVLIIDNNSIERWNLSSFISSLNERFNLSLINNKFENPTQKDINESLLTICNKKIELIIVIGGGSSIDLAKAISAFHNYAAMDIMTISQSIIQETYKKENSFIDIIAIPTTSGTGSELTQWATIWDINRKYKFSIDDIRLKPSLAIIVPELTLTLPTFLTLSTGFDALSHAIEAYWSRHTSPLVQDLSYRAIQIILKNLRNTIENPNDISLRDQMCRASVLSGLAFSQTRTTACHSISYPITMNFNVPHGIAVAMTLNKVAEINRDNFPGSDAIYTLFEEYGGLQNWLDKTSLGVVSLKLSSYGITKKDINTIVENAFINGRMENNPKVLTKEEVYLFLEDLV